MNKKEQKRLMVLNKIERGELTAIEGSQLLALSLRQVKRLRAGYREFGAAALAHGNRGRQPYCAVSDAVRRKIVTLAQGEYAGLNQQHYTEKLAEKEGITVSRSTVRRILLGSGIKSPCKRKAARHRKRRERYPQEGMLLQIDGSKHDWLGDRGPVLSLIGAIDDATGKVLGAVFREQEDAQGYILMLQQVVDTYGIPTALYHDRHSIFEHTDADKESIAEQLEGKRTPTQFGRILEELGITSISAGTPQAKGRIERLWGTFQDRLVSELRLAGIATLGDANSMLPRFLTEHNRRFAVPAQQAGTAFRQLPADCQPKRLFCFKYKRTVSMDNVVSFYNQRFQITSQNGRYNYAKALVEVCQMMDGSIEIYYKDKCLLTQAAPLEAPILRARSNNRLSDIELPVHVRHSAVPHMDDQHLNKVKYKPAPNHPWRTYAKVHIDRG